MYACRFETEHLMISNQEILPHNKFNTSKSRFRFIRYDFVPIVPRTIHLGTIKIIYLLSFSYYRRYLRHPCDWISFVIDVLFEKKHTRTHTRPHTLFYHVHGKRTLDPWVPHLHSRRMYFLKSRKIEMLPFANVITLPDETQHVRLKTRTQCPANDFVKQPNGPLARWSFTGVHERSRGNLFDRRDVRSSGPFGLSHSV